MLKKEAREITGGLSKPSKMPGPAHNLPAAACKTGAKLVKVPGSVCAGCYALKGRYRFNNVQQALQRRLKALEDPRWVDAMVTLIKDQDWFRWHDSGDIQSFKHLDNIFEVCKRTPETKHWMPTVDDFELTWDAGNFTLSDGAGANLEIQVSQSTGGTGRAADRRWIEIDELEWNVEYDVAVGGAAVSQAILI